MPANQVQHDAPVDVAGRFAPRNLEVIKIYLSHFAIDPEASVLLLLFLLPSSEVLFRQRDVPLNSFVRGMN